MEGATKNILPSFGTPNCGVVSNGPAFRLMCFEIGLYCYKEHRVGENGELEAKIFVRFWPSNCRNTATSMQVACASLSLSHKKYSPWFGAPDYGVASQGPAFGGCASRFPPTVIGNIKKEKSNKALQEYFWRIGPSAPNEWNPEGLGCQRELHANALLTNITLIFSGWAGMAARENPVLETLTSIVEG